MLGSVCGGKDLRNGHQNCHRMQLLGKAATPSRSDYAKKILKQVLGSGKPLNYSYFKSGMYDEVVKDIAAVREADRPPT